MNGIIRNSQEDQTIRKVLEEYKSIDDISDLEIDRSRDDNQLYISAIVRSSDPLSQEDVDQLDADLEKDLEISVILDLINFPSLRSD